MNKEEILGAFSLVNNPIVLSEEEVKDVQKAIKQLQQENKQIKEIEKEHQRINGCLHLEIKELKDRIDKAVEYIEKDTRWFDSEYASIYGTLCTCAGANANRLEVMVNPSNLLKILKGDKE